MQKFQCGMTDSFVRGSIDNFFLLFVSFRICHRLFFEHEGMIYQIGMISAEIKSSSL